MFVPTSFIPHKVSITNIYINPSANYFFISQVSMFDLRTVDCRFFVFFLRKERDWEVVRKRE
jgi:hypothetical protein